MISVIDDDESVRDATATLLRSAGYRAELFPSAELFLTSGALNETECLILDVRMPGMSGLELQHHLNSENARVPIIFVAAYDDEPIRSQVIEAGAVAFLNKPFASDVLLASIHEAMSRRDRPG
ncbi:MAG: response regulator [Acidobacteriia bacterium]|nr:response regulator [Terriglobia bacterium]